MTNFLIKTFIKDNQNTSSPSVRGRYATLSGITGIIVNFLLFLVKLVVGLISASVAIVADAFNNVADAGSSLITMLGFRLSSKHVDKEHPLGHGRMEYVTGFIVNILIILVGFELFSDSIGKIISPIVPRVSLLSYILLGLAILVKLWLFFFYRKIGKAINSSAIRASAIDSISDCGATSLVLLSAFLSQTFSISVDGFAGLIVAGLILYAGIKSAKETIDLLLGSPPTP